MNNIAKLLVGVGVVGAVAATTYIVTKKPKVEHKIERVDEDGAVYTQTIVEEGDSILDKIKTAAYKKAIRILAWAIVNKDKLEAAAVLISVLAGIFQVINAVKEFHMGKELHKKLKILDDFNIELERAWNCNVDVMAKRYDNIMKAVGKTVEEVVDKVA